MRQKTHPYYYMLDHFSGGLLQNEAEAKLIITKKEYQRRIKMNILFLPLFNFYLFLMHIKIDLIRICHNTTCQWT